MTKPKVSAFDWRLAEIRLLYAKYFIDQKDGGDPFDDLWFDLDAKELEIGYKPKNGVFLGEVREFRADDQKFQELYGDLAAVSSWRTSTRRSSNTRTRGTPKKWRRRPQSGNLSCGRAWSFL